MYPVVIFLNSGQEYMESIYKKLGLFIPIYSEQLSMNIDEYSIDKTRVYVFHSSFTYRWDLLLELQYVLAKLDNLTPEKIRILSPRDSILKKYKRKIPVPVTFQRLLPKKEKRRKSLDAWTEK